MSKPYNRKSIRGLEKIMNLANNDEEILYGLGMLFNILNDISEIKSPTAYEEAMKRMGGKKCNAKFKNSIKLGKGLVLSGGPFSYKK